MISDGDTVIYDGMEREVLWADGRKVTIVITDPWDERGVVVPIDRIVKKERRPEDGHDQV